MMIRLSPLSTLLPYTTLFRSSRGYLDTARIMADRWEGTVWHAMVLELQAHLERAQGRDDVVRTLLARAAETFAGAGHMLDAARRSEEHTSELQSRENLVCRLL